MKPIGFRHVIIFLVFLGIVISYMLRVNLSVAILEMVNQTALQQMTESQNVTPDSNWKNTTITKDSCIIAQDKGEAKPRRDGQFLWDAQTRGIILGAFFYGFVVTEMPGGWLSYRFGAKWVFGIGMLWTSIFTLLTPLTVHLDMPLLLAVRVLEGFGEGAAFPCIPGIICQWAPPSERSTMNLLTIAGIGVGGMIAFPFSAALCNTDMGWPLLFYVFGIIGIVWVIVWTIFVSNSPSTSYWISSQEREYIQNSLADITSMDDHSYGSVPWVSIAKTPSIWAIVLSHMSYAWGMYTVITLLPTFFKDVHHMDLSTNGLYSALPYLCYTIVSLIVGPVSDFLIVRRILSATITRKIMDGLGHILPAIFLLLTTAIGCNASLAVFLMCLAVGSQAFIGAGEICCLLDISGRFAGVVYGFLNTLGALCGIAAPYIAGTITKYDDTVVGWRLVFGIAAGFYLIASVVFTIFGSAETAEWAKIQAPQEKEDEQRHNYDQNMTISCVDEKDKF